MALILNPGRVLTGSARPQMMTAVAAGAMLASAAVLPIPLVLPMLSVVLVILAGGAALLAWARPHGRVSGRLDLWDVSGALAFVGFCAALMSEPEQVLPLLEATRRGE